jgi:hypothetical protein
MQILSLCDIWRQTRNVTAYNSEFIKHCFVIQRNSMTNFNIAAGKCHGSEEVHYLRERMCKRPDSLVGITAISYSEDPGIRSILLNVLYLFLNNDLRLTIYVQCYLDTVNMNQQLSKGTPRVKVFMYAVCYLQESVC